MKALKELWAKANWWQKILIIVCIPLVLLGIVFLYGLRDTGSDTVKDDIEHHKDHVDEQIKDELKEVEVLKDKEKELKEEHKKLLEEVEVNEDKAKEIVDRIDDAVNSGDSDELERIRQELNSL